MILSGNPKQTGVGWYLESQLSQPIELSFKKATHILQLASDTAPTPEAFAALVLPPEPILLELLALREPRLFPPVMLTSSIAAWRMMNFFMTACKLRSWS